MRHDVTITWQWVSRYDFYVTCPISGKQNSTDSILVSILPYSRPRNSTIIQFFMYNSRVFVTCINTRAWPEELENNKIIYGITSGNRDLESDCDVTISVTFCISSNTDVTDLILVSILPYSRPRNSKIIKSFMYNTRVT